MPDTLYKPLQNLQHIHTLCRSFVFDRPNRGTQACSPTSRVTLTPTGVLSRKTKIHVRASNETRGPPSGLLSTTTVIPQDEAMAQSPPTWSKGSGSAQHGSAHLANRGLATTHSTARHPRRKTRRTCNPRVTRTQERQGGKRERERHRHPPAAR